MAKSLTNGKQMPIPTAPHPSYACQLWTKVQAHLVDGFTTIYFMEFLQELVFHLHILPCPRYKHVDAIKELKEAGGDVSAKENDGSTPMHYAAYNGHVDAIKELKEGGGGVQEKKSLDRLRKWWRKKRDMPMQSKY